MRTTPLLLSACIAMVAACGGKNVKPIPPVAAVDLPRFMGDWYVIANIPSFPERDAYGAVESYAMRSDGRVQTTFTYRKGSFDAPLKTMHPVGTIRPGTGNAIWGMQVVWPIKAEYVIVYLAPDYSQTIIGRSDRDYAWVMARTPTISDADYQANLQRLRDLGYSLEKLRKVPQPPPDTNARR
ncbi:MAG: lipocalin family protein [Luteimonas sp.]